jgi:hypothetical protein
MRTTDNSAVPELASPLQQSSPATPAFLAGGAAAIALVAAAGLGLWRSHAAPVAEPFSLAASDIGPAGFTPLDHLSSGRRRAALSALRLPAPQRDHVATLLAEDRARLGVLAFTDDNVGDGDVIVVSAAGVDQRVALTKGVTTVITPYIPGGTVRVTAVESGCASGCDVVTTALVTATGEAPLKRMIEGESVEITTP